MRPIIHASHNVQVFTTVGLSIALQNLALVLWTADARFVRTDYYAVVVRIGGAAFNVAQIVAFAVAVALTAGLFAFMRWSYTGKVMRATAQDRQASALMGIDTDRVYAITWAVGHRLRRRGRRAAGADLSRVPDGRPAVRADRLRRGRAGRPRRHGGGADRRADRRRGRGGRLLRRSARRGRRCSTCCCSSPSSSCGPPGSSASAAPRRSARERRVAPGASSSSPLAGARAARRARRVPPRQPRPDPDLGRDRGGLERGRRLRRPDLARPRRVLRARRLRRRAPRHPLGRSRRGSASLVGAVVATAIGLVIGYLSNRLRGPYFVLATIAFSQVLLIVGSRWRGFTSGSEGIPVPFRPGFWTLGIADKRVWVWIVLGLAVLAWLVQLYLERSRRGYQLAAVREDEDAALSLGVPARRLKVAAICGERGAHRRVRRAVGAVRRLRRPLLRVLGGPLGPLRAGRDHRRARHGARALPGRRPRHDRRDVPARAVRRHRRRARRDLPDHLRLRADRDGAVGPAGPRRLDRRARCAGAPSRGPAP